MAVAVAKIQLFLIQRKFCNKKHTCQSGFHLCWAEQRLTDNNIAQNKTFDFILPKMYVLKTDSVDTMTTLG
jgi:hypothetical protein